MQRQEQRADGSGSSAQISLWNGFGRRGLNGD